MTLLTRGQGFKINWKTLEGPKAN